MRELLHGGDVSPWAEAAFFAAARAELVAQVIRPALDRGAAVVCDRYIDSSLAYQGIARGLGVDHVLALNLNAIRGMLPDGTFVLLVDPDEARRRSGPPATASSARATSFSPRSTPRIGELGRPSRSGSSCWTASARRGGREGGA